MGKTKTMRTYAIRPNEMHTALVEESHSSNIPILCLSSFTKHKIEERAKAMNRYIPEPLSVQEPNDIARIERGQDVIIDDVATMLTTLLYNAGVEVVTRTMNIVEI